LIYVPAGLIAILQPLRAALALLFGVLLLASGVVRALAALYHCGARAGLVLAAFVSVALDAARGGGTVMWSLLRKPVVFVLALGMFPEVEPASALTMPIPPAGDCRSMSAQGAAVLWRGTFSGRYEDVFDRLQMIYVEGCFLTEYECRRWINEVQSAVSIPGLMRCKILGSRQ
jgi:hypothetical protein